LHQIALTACFIEWRHIAAGRLLEGSLPEVLFRADAAPEVGGGHVTRCLALAGALVEGGWTCRFLVGGGTVTTVPALAQSGYAVYEGEEAWRSAPGKADLIVVDHYRLDAGYENGWRGRVCRILVLDDLADRRHDCDLLLDPTAGRVEADYAGLVPPGCRFLLGPRYALLRPEFARRRREALARRGSGPVERVLIAPGATDPTDLATRLIDAAETLPTVAIDIAIGAAAPHLPRLRERAERSPRLHLHIDTRDMARLMVAADLCLGAGGSTSWERCCLGLPTLLAVIAGNQQEVARGLVAAGAVEIVAENDPAALAASLQRLVNDGARRQAMSAAAAALCDGEGAKRVAACLG
jgi:UDP-2,4-diacetamido-2,4,6-trideoxy-beta-L-altropyranose hydrolase